MINKILVAVDGSETSVKALHCAADLCYISGAELITLFVIHELIKDWALQKKRNETLESKIHDMLNRHLNEIKQSYSSLKTRTLIVKGSPTLTIVETAKKENADLIVIGSRGFRVKDWSLGTISSSVVNLSSINVLVVK